MRRRLLLAALAILLLAAAGPARAEVYHWTDAAGVPHFSDRPEDVPPAYRSQLPAAVAPKQPAAGLPARLEQKLGTMARGRSAAPPAPAEPPRRSAAPDLSKLAFLRHLGAGTLLGACLAVIGFSFLCYALLIQLACRVCGEDVPGFGRALGVVAVQLLAGVGVGIVEAVVLGFAGGAANPVVRGLNAVLGFAVNVSVLRAMLGQTLGKAVAVQFVSILISAAVGVALVLALVAGLGGMAALHASG